MKISPFDTAHMTFYKLTFHCNHGSICLCRTISEIDGDFRWKS